MEDKFLAKGEYHFFCWKGEKRLKDGELAKQFRAWIKKRHIIGIDCYFGFEKFLLKKK